MIITFYSHGKLLLTGEYAVLDGALALALPTQYGQSLSIRPSTEGSLQWKSLDERNNCWYQQILFSGKATDPITQTLEKILCTAKQLNPNFLIEKNFHVETKLEFPRDWGLGSSSTLINNIAQWAQIDAFKLLFESFGGSGYDIACAQQNKPIWYQLKDSHPEITPIEYNPLFKDSLFFVHLNQKQNSKEGIQRYRKLAKHKNHLIEELTNLTKEITLTQSLENFCSLIKEHERLISNSLDIPTVQSHLFPDFPGEIKSLGAWGGDFILAASNEDVINYFKSKGYPTIIRYSDMILS